MKVTLIGTGCGSGALTDQARSALKAAGLVIGARRLLDTLPAGALASDCLSCEAVLPKDILACLQNSGCAAACVLMSGDSGFYSGTLRLLPLLKDYETVVLPGISSVQALSASLGRPWQDWALYSAHGVDCDVVASVCADKPAFFLTGGKGCAADMCRKLCEAGLAGLPVTVGEDLGTEKEKISSGPAREMAEKDFSPLCVLLAEPAPRFTARTPGLPDELFEREEKVPMTKQEVRAAALSKLAVNPDDVCWDIGAGSGSVSVELALHARAVYAVEQKPEALALAEKNRRKFGAWNLRLLSGRAPEALEGLPKPDAVFVGGSGKAMPDILKKIHRENEKARVCVAAIALESLQEAFSALAGLGYDMDVTQLSVSRARPLAGLHLMMAQNPIWLVTGTKT